MKKQNDKGVPAKKRSRVARVPSAKKPTPAGRSTRSREYSLSDEIEKALKQKRRPTLHEMNVWMMDAWNLEGANDRLLEHIRETQAATAIAADSPQRPQEARTSSGKRGASSAKQSPNKQKI